MTACSAAVGAGAAGTTVAEARAHLVAFVVVVVVVVSVEGPACKRIAGPRSALGTVLGDTRHVVDGVLPWPQIFEVRNVGIRRR